MKPNNSEAMYRSERLDFLDFLIKGFPDPDNLVYESFLSGFISRIPWLEYSRLVCTVATLSKFGAHVQYMMNSYQSNLSTLRRKFDARKSRALVEAPHIKERDSERIKTAKAFSFDFELNSMSDEIANMEQTYLRYVNMTDWIKEYIQILKYELKTRQLNGRIDT